MEYNSLYIRGLLVKYKERMKNNENILFNDNVDELLKVVFVVI